MKIGICISTRNRKEVFEHTYSQWVKYLPKGAILIVVDDASDYHVKEADFRFEEQAGIAKVKNKSIELLEAKGVTDFVLSDNDVYPINENWHLPYINSGLNHAMLTYEKFANGGNIGNRIIKRHANYNEFLHPCGILLYYKKICFETVGGMNEVFGLGMHEHVELSRRIFNAGLTPKPYIDVPNSLDNFYSHDHHQTIDRTLSAKVRAELVKKNTPIFNKNKLSKDFVPYRKMNNIIITTYFTGTPDPQKDGKRWQPNIEDLSELIGSLSGQKLVVLHDCFDDIEIENVEFVKVKTTLNPYFQRWVSIKEYLDNNNVDFLFCVDATDVKMLKNPFGSMTATNIYVGDEPSYLNNKWLITHHQEYLPFILGNANKVLLNAGLLGGKSNVIKPFLKKLIETNEKKPNVMTDMAAFNYTAYTYFKDIIFHGRIVNTVFKSFKPNNISFWQHK